MSLAEGMHILPTPDLAGWTEETRVRASQEAMLKLQCEGGTILKHARVRNPAFDHPGQRTTFQFTVGWERTPI